MFSAWAAAITIKNPATESTFFNIMFNSPSGNYTSVIGMPWKIITPQCHQKQRKVQILVCKEP
jgi:hypothetical protein